MRLRKLRTKRKEDVMRAYRLTINDLSQPSLTPYAAIEMKTIP